MEILRTIKLYCDAKNLPFLVIGGHAANAFGISRQTGDLDLLVRGSDKAQWQELLGKLRYKEYQSDQKFSRFSPDQIAAWPIDLMYVDSTTFAKLSAESTEHDFGAVCAALVSGRHLAILKIHALKHHAEHRVAKDYGDLLQLLKSGKAVFSDTELRELCERYAHLALYHRLQQDLAGGVP